MFRHRSLPLVASALALVTVACAGGGSTTPPDGTHTTRAEIVQLPSAPGGELYLRHESIPDFRDADGKRVGMASMTMPFSVAADIDLTGYSEGSRVEVDLEIRWQGRPPLLVTRLARLPDGTRLEFDPPPQPEEAAAGATGTGETPR